MSTSEHVAKLKRQQDRAVRRMKGLIVLSEDTDDDGNYHGSSSDDSNCPAPAADAYSCTGDWRSKGPARKW